MRYTRDKLLAEAASRERIQLAILLCSEGSIERLRHFVDVARKDYRDVLYWVGLPPEDVP